MRWTRRPGAPPAVPSGQGRTIDFVAYATDSVIWGRVALEDERLSDLLTRRERYAVRDLSFETLGRGRIRVLDSATVLREELCVVAAPRPRGNPARRVRTRPHLVRAKVGPYELFGYIHATPGVDPIALALGRSIIPMTFGSIRYQRGPEIAEYGHDTMLINGEKVDWLRKTGREEAGLARAPRPASGLEHRERANLPGENR